MIAFLPTAKTVAIGAVGAVIAGLVGLPAPALIGAAFATALASWAGATLSVDTRLRDSGFLIIGLSLGSGIDPQFFGQIGGWAVSLALLCVSVIITLFGNQWLLMRLFAKDKDTALLASAPGTMSVAIAIAMEGPGDAVSVLVVQTMRLFCLAAALPLIFFVTGAGPEAAPVYARFGLAALVVLAAFGLGVGLLFKRVGLPAAFMLGGLVISAIAHAGGWVAGLPPNAVMIAGFCLTGSVIGSRFSGVAGTAIMRLFWAALATVVFAALISALFAGIVTALTDLPLAQVWLAFAPGGVEAMAAIGLAMGYDPGYVALHHVVRIGLLAAVLSVWQR